MKKMLFLGLMLTVLGMMVAGCNGCTKPENNYEQQEAINGNDYDGVAVDFSAGVEQITALHRQMMFDIANGAKYCWYETNVLFNDSIKAETIDDLHVVDVTNIFQMFGPELCQSITSNVTKGTLIPAAIPGLWIEDFDLSNAEIKLTVTDALLQLKQWNGIIPPANSITLRKPVGPKPCNAQYVIGNAFEVIFIDAVTGNVTNWNPAFPTNVK